MSPKKAGNRELTGKIKVKEFLLNGGQVPLWNIPENKLNQKQALDIKPIYSRRREAHAVGAFRLRGYRNDGSAAVNAILSGADFIHVGMAVPTYAFSLYARPEIIQATDLRCKIPSVIRNGASSNHASIAMLRHYKMTQQDMKVLYFSRQEDALAALNQGIVSAVIHSAPPTTLMARRLGFKEIVNIGRAEAAVPVKAATADPKMLYDNSIPSWAGKQRLRQRTVRQQVTGFSTD